MKIIKDYFIKKYHKGFKRNVLDIEEVVIHHTDGVLFFISLKNWMLSGVRKKQYKKGVGLFNLTIDRQGIIYQLADLNRWFYHSNSGKYDKKTVGIELMHKQGKFTKKQYESLNYLLFEFLPKETPNLKRIVSHDHNRQLHSVSTKNCPGPEFNWNEIKEELKKNKRNFSYSNNGCINILDREKEEKVSVNIKRVLFSFFFNLFKRRT